MQAVDARKLETVYMWPGEPNLERAMLQTKHASSEIKKTTLQGCLAAARSGKEKHRTEERSESTSGVRRKFGYAENEDPRRAAIVEGLCTNRVSVFGSVRLAAD